jgi:hypothetical protein
MITQLHEWDIHIVCRGADDASGAGGAAADGPPRQAEQIATSAGMGIVALGAGIGPLRRRAVQA